MRAFFISLVLLAYPIPPTVQAQRLDWKLEDFRPLTELPWSEEEVKPLAQVISAIYHEPDSGVRKALLDEYLRTIPTPQLGQAMDLCIEFEGTRSPDDLVEYFITLWATRDPGACWARTKELLKVAGIEDGWLHYDSWKGRSRLTVQNQQAIKASKYWLTSRAFSGFISGVEQASLPRAERIRYLKEFADTYLGAFGWWPGGGRGHHAPQPSAVSLSYLFAGSPKSRRGYIASGDLVRAEIAARRYIKAHPADAPEVIQQLSTLEFKGEVGTSYKCLPSRAHFQLWAEADLAGMTRWVDAQDATKAKDFAERERLAMPKGILLSRVDAAKRSEWLAHARKTKALYDLLAAWALSDPKAALDEALKTKDAEIIDRVFRDVAYGPQGGQPLNTSHPGLGIIRDFDFSVLPGDIYKEVVGDSAIVIMELWGDIDIAENARFGIAHIMRLLPEQRSGILAFFRGENEEFADDGGVLDRTFCSLRVWAATKPDEMKAWIATLKDADLRTALTWLAENPWGPNEEE